MTTPTMRRRAAGFTLVELLVVIAIIVILVTVVATGLMAAKTKAYKAKSVALVEKLKTALDSYYNEFRDFPPDGFDKPPAEPGWANASWGTPATDSNGVWCGSSGAGKRYKSTGALIYFLWSPLVNITYTGADGGSYDPRQTRTSALKPFLSDMAKEAFSMTQHDDTYDPNIAPLYADASFGGYFKSGWEKCELVDSYLRPLHYDKLKDPDPSGNYFDKTNTGPFRDATKCHTDSDWWTNCISNFDYSKEQICPDHSHDIANGGTISSTDHVDPRSAPYPDGCTNTSSTAPDAPRNRSSFDLWSHGTSISNGHDSITNWGK